MRKTGSEIENDIYVLLADSALKTTITGSVYKEGVRPANSVKEDVVVSFLTGVETEEFQEGYVNVNIYVPDIDNGGGEGALVKDISRCKTLEIIANELFNSNSLLGNYQLKMANTIKTFAEPDIKQHFVNCKVQYRLSTL